MGIGNELAHMAAPQFVALVIAVGCLNACSLMGGHVERPLIPSAAYTDAQEVESIEEFRSLKGALEDRLIQGVDLRSVPLGEFKAANVTNALFRGTQLTLEQDRLLRRRGARIIEPIIGNTFNAYQPMLYSQAELDGPGTEGTLTLDEAIFAEYGQDGRFPADTMAAHARSLHDDAMEDALREYQENACQENCKGLVGIMGGGSELRGTGPYRQTVAIARALTRAGYFVVTGGGTGMMEAGNLGAYLARASDEDVTKAIDQLATRPFYKPDSGDGYTQEDYKEVARHIRDEFAPIRSPSLGIPTWFYGHEPTNAFATDIAKYFSNGIREDRLLEISRRGLVVVKGSAGTRQEIFMEAAQEHYATFGKCSPIIFFGDTFLGEFEIVRKAAEKAARNDDPKRRTFYINVLKTAASIDEVVNVLDSTPPMEADDIYCPQSSAPTSSALPATLSGLGRTFRASYVRAIETHAEKLRRAYPIITQDLLNMTLRVGTGESDRFRMDSGTYMLMARSTHTPLTIYSILSKDGFGTLEKTTLSSLEAYRNQLNEVIEANAAEGPAELVRNVFSILKISESYLGDTLATGRATRASFETYAGKLRPLIQANLHVGAQEQLGQFREQMDRWKVEFPQANWSNLRVVVLGGHQARDSYALKLFFQWLLREPGYEHKVVYAEDQTLPIGADRPALENAALELLTKVDFEQEVGRLIFGDVSRMQRDVMGPPARRILSEWGRSTWP